MQSVSTDGLWPRIQRLIHLVTDSPELPEGYNPDLAKQVNREIEESLRQPQDRWL